MHLIQLTALDLGLAALLVVALAALSVRLRLEVARPLLIAALRTTVQLLLVGLVLKAVFAQVHLVWIGAISVVMLLMAGREVMARQRRRLAGWWGFGVGTLSMFVSSFSVTLLALVVVIGPQPWYQPQYAIPLLGMLLGNTMSGIAVAMDRLTQSAWQQRAMIEGRLLLGDNWSEAIGEIRRESTRSGLIPILNAMAAAGIVSLPGMMTGQILAGSPPVEAVKYQILIMFLITAGTGFGTVGAVWLGAKRLFDERQRLRIDRLREPA
ncbi:MAG: iron export ABC transporter permease subunit FetB [Chromatiales bacterium 21-64-14]|nr:MAG: iron export ABC transporter permease subunit FetB [Chromatiales bacterium 21-64-14]HQU16366.1 iron export ABC transporter permease subunit FetB [Gammaproteobacteria bacterium]